MAPDNFHWTLIEVKSEDRRLNPLEAGKQALFFGYDQDGRFRATFGARAPRLHQGARAIRGAPTPLSQQCRGELEALGFRAGLRSMRRTRRAG
eukprot:1911072-Pyramimonas_sp.AAC.1